jgi:putative peptide zinc metalloprotease protein
MSGAARTTVSPMQLRPRLKPHVDFHRHLYRNEVWYVFHDRAVDRFYRVSCCGADLIGALDGSRSMSEIVEDFRSRAATDLFETTHAAEFVLQLNALGLLRTGIAPSAAAIESKHDAIRRRRILAGLKSPLAVRVPLFDPTWLLNRLAPLGRFLFSRTAGAVWGAVVLAGLTAGVMHWGEMAGDFSDRLLSAANLGTVGLIYPAVKILHELAHGMALRRYGAEVRRMGVMFVAFMPMPYVDASASVVLRDKYQRMMVAGAGIVTELFIAALAMMGWAFSEAGTFHNVCYNTLLITGLSTLLFNGNPLQRYDGYYLLCDLAEIPSLGMRATQYTNFLMRRWILADAAARAPSATASEKRWFLTYGILSAAYRTWLVVAIGLFVARTYPVIGGGLALWAIGGLLAGPASGLAKLARGRGTARRGAAFLRAGGLCAALGLGLFWLPLPLRLAADGVVWLPDEANVRARTGGEIAAVLLPPGARVAAGQSVLRLDNRETETALIRARAELDELEAEHTSEAGRLRLVAAGKVDDKLVAAHQRLAEAERDVANLVVTAPLAGTLLYEDYSGLLGRYLPKGQAPAAVWNGDAVLVRVLVPLEEIDRLRNRAGAVEIRPGYDTTSVLPGHIARIVPSATDWLPSMVLAWEGGGSLAVMAPGRDTRPADDQLDVVPNSPARLAVPMFEIDVQCDEPLPVAFLNGRARVRFLLGTEPPGFRIIRWIRLTFLKELHA